MSDYNPIKSYPYSKNRLLIIDWASLSYHQLHSLLSKRYSEQVDVETPEDELRIWRNGMFSKLLKYIHLFNPKDIILTLEGKEVWRFDYVKDYYNEHVMVYWNKTGYYVHFDNYFYFLHKNSSDQIEIEKLDLVLEMESIVRTIPAENQKRLGDMPDRVNQMIWDLIVPKYKGNRGGSEWNFLIDRKVWKDYKEKFAATIAPLFRAKVIGTPEAEGDDVMYVAIKTLSAKYDSVILATSDSDLNQMMYVENLAIFNHRKEEMVVCPDPARTLDIKILSGDKSDNINGMALPGKKTQVGPKTAEKLLESSGNLYSDAQRDGWDKQYVRNKTLIDMSCIPRSIESRLVSIINEVNSDLADIEYINNIGFNQKLVDEMFRMKSLGFYCLLTPEYIEKNPDIFNPKLFEHDTSRADEILYAPKRTFGDMKGVFNSPIDLDSSPW